MLKTSRPGKHPAKTFLLFWLSCMSCTTKTVISTVIVTKLYEHMEAKSFYGKLSLEHRGQGETVVACAVSCVGDRRNSCKGFAFSSNQPIHSRCIYIIDDTIITDRTSPTWDGYEFYYLRVARKSALVQWKSPQPRLYFPLDSDTGTRHGPDPDNVAFIGGGIVGNAFYNPISDDVGSYYRLGHYDSSQYCFPVPTSCPLGVTLVFWASILSETGHAQGLLTTKPQSGQGLIIRWKSNQGFKTVISRVFDNKEEVLLVGPQNFLNNYGYGHWFHFALAYRFNGTSLGNNMAVYLNGIARPDREKKVLDSSHSPGYDGGLELGHKQLGQDKDYGNILMDEVIIWEEMLTHEEITSLYEAYQIA